MCRDKACESQCIFDRWAPALSLEVCPFPAPEAPWFQSPSHPGRVAHLLPLQIEGTRCHDTPQGWHSTALRLSLCSVPKLGPALQLPLEQLVFPFQVPSDKAQAYLDTVQPAFCQYEFSSILNKSQTYLAFPQPWEKHGLKKKNKKSQNRFLLCLAFLSHIVPAPPLHSGSSSFPGYNLYQRVWRR